MLWAEPAPTPSEYLNESEDATPPNKFLWAEPAPIPSEYLSESVSMGISPVHTKRPSYHSPTTIDTPELKTTRVLMELSISPIQKVTQELAWDEDQELYNMNEN